ncbi:MAG: putative zinc-binding metallopeptidase [Planctomycetota bacterium]
MTAKTKKRRKKHWWQDLPTEELLDVRLSELELTIDGTALEQRVTLLHDELKKKGLRFKPYVYLSTDWFTPEGSTGFAVPFYLAHPRLVRLEHDQMFEAEGSTHAQCMKLLRHETGHAIDNAYKLHRRADWRRTFGNYSLPYAGAYQPNPTSRAFVHHLGWWYAQSHPAEDYAETFAVWMTPHARWEKTYSDWPALKKLQALDAMLSEVGKTKQPVTSRDRPESLPTKRMTLREHYKKKKSWMGPGSPWQFDRELQYLFGGGKTGGRQTAASFLRDEQQELRTKVSALTGQYRYVVDQTLDAMIQRCRELNLRMSLPKAKARLGAAVLATMGTLRFARGYRPNFRR